jgi:phosphate starvation-inducible protein PhoH and related proteins
MQKKFTLKGIDQLVLLGSQDANLRLIQKHFSTKITVRGNDLVLDGEANEIRTVEKLFSELILLINRNNGIKKTDIDTLINLLTSEKPKQKPVSLDQIIVNGKKNFIRPRTKGQQQYFQALSKNDIIFAIGPAGTGKTYLAVAMAIAHLKAHEVDRIILARPAVEAGESLGFLPGDLREKVDPYLRPLYDALYDMLPTDKLKKMMERDEVEIVPLAYMRGRTLNNAFVILDEAQNSSENQMKMFLTRLGVNSKAIVTGDVTQIDLPEKNRSGLVHIQNVLKNIDGIEFVYLTDRDVVRHKLVRDIIIAYDHFEDQSRKNQNGEIKQDGVESQGS